MGSLNQGRALLAGRMDHFDEEESLAESHAAAIAAMAPKTSALGST
jgi:hypothetical protein